MRVAHNITAMNAHRNLTMTNFSLKKSLERLSSGFRINSAADDAGGLAISEKLRAQISGIEVAVSNAQDGISLIQTAEGALDRCHAILRRLRDLTEQAANGDKTDADREQYQAEMDQLVTEIDRIAATTEYNTKKLLNGNIGASVQEKADSNGLNQDARLVVDGIVRLGGEYKVSVYTPATRAKAIIVGNVAVAPTAPAGDAAGGLYTFMGGSASVAGDYTFKVEVEGKVALATVSARQLAGDSMNEAVRKINEELEEVGINATASYDQTGSTSYNNTNAAIIVSADEFGAKHEVRVEVSSQPPGGGYSEALRNATPGTAFAIYSSDLANSTNKLLKTTQLSGGNVDDLGLLAAVSTGTFGITTRDGIRTEISVTSMIATTADATIEDLLNRLNTVANVSATYDETTGSFSLVDSATGTENFRVLNGNDEDYGLADLLGIYRVEYGNQIEGVRLTRTTDYVLKVTDPDLNIGFLRANLGDRSSLFASQSTTAPILSSGVDPDLSGDLAAGAGGIAGVSFNLEEVQMTQGESYFSILANAGNLVLQIGPNEGSDHRMTVSVDDMSISGLGLPETLDIATQRGAMALMDSLLIDSAITRISEQRARLGAFQNRLEHTVKNLGVTRENLQGSESRIRDADMAEEMMDFTKEQIMLQAGTAMLAQANQVPQSILQLLQG